MMIHVCLLWAVVAGAPRADLDARWAPDGAKRREERLTTLSMWVRQNKEIYDAYQRVAERASQGHLPLEVFEPSNPQLKGTWMVLFPAREGLHDEMFSSMGKTNTWAFEEVASILEEKDPAWGPLLRPLSREPLSSFHESNGSSRAAPIGMYGLTLSVSSKPRGVKVVGIRSESPFAASLKRGDIITAVERQALVTPADLVVSLGRYPLGTLLYLSMVRPPEVEPARITVSLGRDPEASRLLAFMNSSKGRDELERVQQPCREKMRRCEAEEAALREIPPEVLARRKAPRFVWQAKTGDRPQLKVKTWFSEVPISFESRGDALASLRRLHRELQGIPAEGPSDTEAGGHGSLLHQREAVREAYAFLSTLTDDQFRDGVSAPEPLVIPGP